MTLEWRPAGYCCRIHGTGGIVHYVVEPHGKRWIAYKQPATLDMKWGDFETLGVGTLDKCKAACEKDAERRKK